MRGPARRALCLLAAISCGSSVGSSPDASPPVMFDPVPGTTMVLTHTLSVSTRQIVVFVPAFAYDRSQAVYLFLNDGQDIGALGLVPTLDDLWKKNAIRPMVVAAMPVSPGGDRLQDYGTAEHDVAIPCDTGDTGAPLLGTKAGDFGRYVVDQALPAVQAAVGFRAPAARTGLLGASLGGLSAFSIAWDHPEAFGFAGAMSGSFWWRTQAGTVEQRQQSRIMQNIVARSSGRPGFRAWFEA